MRDSLKLPILGVWGILVLVLYWGRAGEPVVASDILRQWAISLGFAAIGAYAIWLDVRDRKRIRPLLLGVLVFALPYLAVAYFLLQDSAESGIPWGVTGIILVDFFMAWGASALTIVGGVIAVWRLIEQRGSSFLPFVHHPPVLPAE